MHRGMLLAFLGKQPSSLDLTMIKLTEEINRMRNAQAFTDACEYLASPPENGLSEPDRGRDYCRPGRHLGAGRRVAAAPTPEENAETHANLRPAARILRLHLS